MKYYQKDACRFGALGTVGIITGVALIALGFAALGSLHGFAAFPIAFGGVCTGMGIKSIQKSAQAMDRVHYLADEDRKFHPKEIRNDQWRYTHTKDEEKLLEQRIKRATQSDAPCQCHLIEKGSGFTF